jgi:hypothetical protein
VQQLLLSEEPLRFGLGENTIRRLWTLASGGLV